MQPGLLIFRLCILRFLPHTGSAHHAEHRGLPAVGIDPIIFRIDKNVPSRNIDGDGLDPLIAGKNHNRPALDINGGFTVDRVVPCGNDQLPASDTYPVIDVDSVLRGGNRQLPAGDDKLIVNIYAVFISSFQRKGAAAVNRQILMRENHAAGFIAQCLLRILFSADHAVFRAFGKSQEDFISLVYPQTGIV